MCCLLTSLWTETDLLCRTDTEIVIHADNDFATVAFLRIKKAELQRKSHHSRTALIPSTLDNKYKAIKQAAFHFHTQQKPRSLDISSPIFCHPSLSRPAQSSKGSYVSVSNVQMDPVAHNNYTIEEEVKKCFQILSGEQTVTSFRIVIPIFLHSVDCLEEKGLTLSQIAFINIFISSMDLFLLVNTVYATFFGTSPPARACVGVDLPEGTRVRLDCIAFRERNSLDRQALHVQGLSYWAPANIGPYSQAIMVWSFPFDPFYPFKFYGIGRRAHLYLRSDWPNSEQPFTSNSSLSIGGTGIGLSACRSGYLGLERELGMRVGRPYPAIHFLGDQDQ